MVRWLLLTSYSNLVPLDEATTGNDGGGGGEPGGARANRPGGGSCGRTALSFEL